MIWTCKICGQGFDDMFCGDYICDDCFDKMKREEKKQKQRNTPFFRFLSLALVVSFMLCIFSGFGIAHADELQEVETIKVSGKFKEYDVIRFNVGESISSDFLFDFAITNSYSLVYYYLVDFDPEGKIHLYSNNSLGCFLYSELGSLNRVFSFNGSIIDNPNTLLREYSAIYSYSAEGQSYKFKDNDDLSYTDGTVTPFSYTDGKSGFTDFFGSEKYLIRVPCSSSNETDGILSSLFTGSQNDLDLDDKYSYSAKFHSFSSLNDGDVFLNMLDWIGAGKQYPIVDFSINDSGNNHSYSLRISTNKNYVDTCMSLWEDWRKGVLSSVGSVIGAKALILMPFFGGNGETFVSDLINIGGFGPVPLLGITQPRESGTASAIRTIAQYNLLNSIGDLSYITEYNLTSPYLQFNEGESCSRAYSVCLPDYVTITKGLLYKLDIIDNNTGLILDTAYFTNDTTFAKTNTGYGTKVYNYSDYNDLLGDVDGGNGYVNNDSYTQGDSLHNDNPNDIVDWDKYNQYDFTNIQNLTGTLNSATAGLGSFFMACYNIIPPVFVSILLGTFTLVIILRVLGR